MANLQKYKRKEMPAVVKEATRQLRSYKNKVDPSRSHLNYTLVGGEDYKSIAQFVDKRVRDVMGPKIKAQTKANMRPLGTWVITLPTQLEGLSAEEQRRFFESCTEFVSDRYGAENLAYAIVHNDETRPHIHVGVVPACTSRKTGKTTVSSASMFTKEDLGTFHDDLDKHIALEFGQAGLMRNGRGKGKYTLDEMKERDRIASELKSREEEVAKREKFASERISIAQTSSFNMRLKEAQLKDRELELEQREIELLAREKDLEERESALKRAWNDFANQAVQYLNKFAKWLKWGKNQQSELVMNKVLDNGRKYQERVATPVRQEFTKEQLDEISAIVTLDKAVVDANDLISDLDVNQPSALER